MTRRFITLLLSLFTIHIALAMPAKPGTWRILSLSNGQQIHAQLCGDEHFNFFKTAEGQCYTFDPQTSCYAPVEMEQLQQIRSARMQSRSLRARSRQGSEREQYATDEFIGKKKGLVILVDFPDQGFQEAHDKALYQRILNEIGFNEGRFKGSVKDYFLAQSSGRFELDFDVVGPIRMDSSYTFYGQRLHEVDEHADQMVIEACQKADAEVNFADYDWDGNGEVDQVFILYAGKGESNGGGPNTIWPHEYDLVSWRGTPLPLDGVNINTYACSNEVDSQWQIEGIGTICHEFSHCMGLPDLYDTYYAGNFGLGHWDLLSHAGWNDDGFQPAGYTSYEKMVCGWLTPIELSDTDEVINGMRPLSEGGDAYIIYNQAEPNEYYLLENRQPSGWDESLPGRGLLVLHVDYDKDIWEENYVNTIVDNRNIPGSDRIFNDHQRLTIIHADNDDDKSYWSFSGNYYSRQTESTDAYPYLENDSLTDNSSPAAVLYNGNVDRHRFMNRGIYDIAIQADSSISFRYAAVNERIVYVDSLSTNRPDTTGAIFYESFNECLGTGGNDGIFKGNATVASADFLPDLGGWQSLQAGGAARCAKFGSGIHQGITISPSFELAGDTLELSFYAAPWNKDDPELHVTSTNPDIHLADTIFMMQKEQWTHFTTQIWGNGITTLTFTPGLRFFLDEVLIRKVLEAVSIHSISIYDTIYYEYYSIDGRKVSKPSSGIIIRKEGDGTVRKVLIR